MDGEKRRGTKVMTTSSVVRFGPYELDLRSAELRKKGVTIRLQEQPFLILVALLERPGEVVLRDEIRRKLWPDGTVVEFDHGINAAVKRLRDALCESAEKPRYIETLARKGYRFIGKVEVDLAEQADSPTFHEEAVAPIGSSLNSDTALSLSFPELPETTNTLSDTATSATDISSAREKGRSRRPLLMSVLGIASFVAVLMLWRAVREKDVPRNTATHLATEQRISSHPAEVPIESAVISPNGKYVAYADSTGLYLYDIASGEIRPWAVPKDFIALPNSWFSDSTRLLVTRIQAESHTQSLWTLSVLGGTPRLLKEDATAGSISPDGTRIAYLPVPDARALATSPDLFKRQLAELGKELWLMDPDGSNQKRLAQADASGQGVLNRIGSVVWSPHGKRIAYIESHGPALPDPTQSSFSLQTQDVNGNDPQTIWNGNGQKPALCWSPDGRILYGVRAELGSERDDEDVRAIQVDERTGRAINEPQTITHGQGRIGGLSTASTGKQLLLWRSNTQPQAFIVEFKAGNRRLESPRRLTMDANGNLAEAWTSDSKTVLFVSNRNGTWKLFRQAIDQTTAEALVQGRSLFLPRLSSDGSQVLYLAYPRPADASLPVALMRMSLAGGPTETVLQTSNIVNFQCASFSSRRCILSRQMDGHHIFFSFDTGRGLGSQLLKVDPITNWSLSPDGSKLAIFLDNHRIQVRYLETGATHDFSVKGWPLDNGDWSADGKSLFMQSVTANGNPVIIKVNQSGNAKAVLEGAPNTSFLWLIPSPNGHFGILEAEVPGDNNIWMVENF